MSKKRTDFLSGFVVEQYPIDILKQIINSVVDIVDNFIIELGEDEYLSLSSTSRYDERVGSSQRNTTSKIETMCINKMKSEEKMKEFIYKYGQALNFLNREERQVFIHLFIKKSDTLTIYDDMKIGSNQYNVIKKSAIVRFSIKMGLEKFVPLFRNETNLIDN